MAGRGRLQREPVGRESPQNNFVMHDPTSLRFALFLVEGNVGGLQEAKNKRVRRCGMPYFDCFMIGAWMFAMGWFLGAVYVQNHEEKTEHPKRSPEGEACRRAVLASASAD